MPQGPKCRTKKTLNGPQEPKCQFWEKSKANAPTRTGFGNVWGHNLAKNIAVRAENSNRHTNLASLSQIWPPKNLGDGQKIRSGQKTWSWKMGCKRQAGALGPIWGPFGARSGPVWGPIYFGAHLGLFGAHLGPGLLFCCLSRPGHAGV